MEEVVEAPAQSYEPSTDDRTQHRRRWKIVALVSTVVLLLLGYTAYSALGAYLTRTDPIPLEDNIVIDVGGNIVFSSFRSAALNT